MTESRDQLMSLRGGRPGGGGNRSVLPSFIDRIETELAGFPAGLHSVSVGNHVRIVDTPHAWGAPMTERGVVALARTAVTDLARTVARIVGAATKKVDIVSLGPPTGIFWQFLKGALGNIVFSAAEPITIRFLFGWVPTRDEAERFRNELAELVRQNDADMGRVTLLAGQYRSYQSLYWNHAKIVAADGREALVGGHNLWDTAYSQYPPVHDLSVHVVGPAAGDAHGFADHLWEKGGRNLVVHHLDSRYEFVRSSREVHATGSPSRPMTRRASRGRRRTGRALACSRWGGRAVLRGAPARPATWPN